MYILYVFFIKKKEYHFNYLEQQHPCFQFAHLKQKEYLHSNFIKSFQTQINLILYVIINVPLFYFSC